MSEPRRIRLRFHGTAAILLLAGLLLLPPLLGPTRTPAEADRQIRGYLLWQLTSSEMAGLRESGRQLPDSATALRWLRERAAITGMVTDSVIVHRTMLASPVRLLPVVLVRWTAHRKGEPPVTRYFRIKGRTMYGVLPWAGILWRLRL